MSQVAVIDYGAGNTRSVLRALVNAGADHVVLASDPEALMSADRVVLPGVGAGGAALDGLRRRQLETPLIEYVKHSGRPVLGICVGMQMLADTLHEFGTHRGLGLIPGEVFSLDQLDLQDNLRIPHMGWNSISVRDDEPVFSARKAAQDFYFAHSFAFKPAKETSISATTNYGAELCVAVRKDNLLGVQFHPEKSQINGEKFLSSFLTWTP